jgi:tetratricopeptide (TPR) repeat protein
MLGILAVSLLAATVINPYFLKLHAQVMTNIKMPNIIYWGSLFTEYFKPPTHGPLIFFTLILGAGGLITLKQRLPVMLTSLAIIAAFLIVRSAYNATLFAVLAFPFMVLSFSAVGEYLIGSLRTGIGKQAGLLKPAVQVVFVVLIILSILPITSNCAYARLGSASSFGFGIEENLYPSGPKTLLDNPAFPDRAINLAADGGYLAFNYGRTIFVDYRPGCYERELLGNLNGMLLGNADAYDTIMETYRPEAVILNTLTPASAQGLVTLLSRRVWKLAYFDGVTAILLLDKEEYSPLLNNAEIQAAGLARLEAARAAYSEEVSRGCRAGNPVELIGSGKIFLALNRPAESRAIFSLLLQGNQSVPGWWLGLGNSQLMLKDFEAAALSLKTATELAPDNWYAWAGYANVCNRLGRTVERDEALQAMKALSEEMTQPADVEEPATEAEPVPAEKKTQSIQDIEIPE